MSILEKAYLKSLANEKEDGEKTSNPELLDVDYSQNMPKKDAKEIVSSRTRISRMWQESVFSPEQLQEKKLIYSGMKDALLLDRYRNLRTKLLASSDKHNFTTLVTSVVPDENSALVAANIAATFALDEAKTSMLIEANIHSPYLNKVFEHNQSAGLIDYLEAVDWSSDKVLCRTGIPRLRYVPSGLPRENSAEYFTSDKMEGFIEELVKRYPDRYPIINAPSIMNSADTRILIELCEKVVLVLPYGKCSEEEIAHAAIAIGEEKLVGVVLSQF